MRKNITNLLATIGIAVILSQFLPWWSVMVASFITALAFSLKKTAVFLVPFLAIMVFWVVYSFWLSSANDFILAKKIAVLLPLNGNEYLLVLVTGIIGGIAGGFSAIFGKECSLLVTKKK